MNIYLLISIILLGITLVYTYKYDTGIFLLILLIISISLYINDVIMNELNILLSPIKKIEHIVNIFDDKINNLYKNIVNK
jgi:hypothetical protein